MKTFTTTIYYLLVTCCILLSSVSSAFAQHTFASSQQTGIGGVLCLNCSVTAPANAADGNLQTFSILNVSLGLAAQTRQDLVFPGTTKVAANTPVSVKIGSGDNLLSLQALGAVYLQAYNGSSPVGTPLAANSLITVAGNNNQAEVTFKPTATYDRVRVTLDGGLVGALNSIYLYDAFYTTAASAACNTPFDELHGVSSGPLNAGLSVGGVTNPEQAIDGNPATAATLDAGVGLVGAYAQQTAIFSSPSVLGDSVRLRVSIPANLVTAGVFANISVTTYNGNTSNNDSQSLNGSLLTLRLLDAGSNTYTITLAPQSVFDRVQLRLGGGIANVLSTLNLYEVQRVIPKPVVKVNNTVVSDAQVCQGGTATLTTTVVPNTTVGWFTAATGGSPVATGESFTPTAPATTTTYYAQAMRAGCTDASDRTPVTITVNPIPVAPVIANSSINICNGQTATFAAQAAPGVIIKWYAAVTGGTAIATGNSFTTPALTATTSYYAEALSGGTCNSPTRTQVTANISSPPATPILATTGVSICSGDVAVLSVSNPVNGTTYNWYATATGGTVLQTGTTFTTPALTNNTSYYAEAVSAGGCISTQRAQANVTVEPKPANPVLAANNTTVAAGQTATASVTNTQTGVTYNWYTSATASTPVFTGATFTTPALYANTTYYVSAVNSTGCTSAERTAITIDVTINNNTPCSFANAQTSSVNGIICVACNVTNAALAADADTTTASTLHVVAGVGGYAEQQLVFQQPGFAGDTVKLGLQTSVNLADAAVAGPVQVILYNGTTAVGQYALDNSVVKVSLLRGANGRYVVYIPATASYNRVTVRLNSGVAGLLTALQIYYAQQEFPAPVFNPVSPEICRGSTATINVTSPQNGTINWFTAPAGGTSVHTGAVFTTPVLNANTTYYIEYSRNTCTGPVRYPVQILVDDVPAAPIAAVSNETINSGQTATLVATPPANATVNWYTAATGGTPVASGNNFITPALTSNTTYYAESASGSCVSPTRTPVTVTVNSIVIPDIAVTPPTQTINAGETATFTASSTTPGAVFNWYATATGGNPVATGATFTTPAQFANTTFYAEATIPATGAVSATRATAGIIVNQTGSTPVACDAAIDQTTATSGLLCLGCTVNNAGGSVDNDRNTFAQLSVPVGLVNSYASQTLRFAVTGHAADSVVVELGIPGSLADISAIGSVSLATYNGITFNNDRFNVNGSLVHITLLNGTSRFRIVFAAQNDFDRVEIRLNSAVAGVLSALNIYDANQEVPAPIVAVANTTICQGTQATITATASNDAIVKWYTSATGGTPIFTGLVFTTPALNTTTTFYAEASRTLDGCTQQVRTPATVTVNPIPVAPAIAQNEVTVCAGSTATFTAQAVTGVTVTWYSTATGGTPVATGNSFTTTALTATTVYYAEAAGAGSCGSATRTQVTANVNNVVTNPVLAQSSVQVCAGAPAMLTATSPQSGVTFNWYTSAAGGTPVFTGAQFTTPALTANTSYYVEAVAGNCTSPDRVKADVIVNPAPAAPSVTVNPANAQITSGQTATLTATSTTAGAIINWYTTPTGGTPITTGATFTTPALMSTTTYYAESVNTTGCVSTTRTAVTVNVIPVFSTSCDFASTQVSDVNGGLACIGCAINDPTFAVDADTTNFSRLTLPVSVAGSFVSQQLIFGQAGLVGDSVSVKIRIPASLATAGVLNQLQIASYNGATYNGDRISLDNNAVKLLVLSGGQTALVKFAPQAAYDRVEIRLNSAVASLLNSADVFFASKQVEAPQLAVSTVSICSGNTATFTVSNARAGISYQWFTAQTGGMPVGTGTTFTTPVLSATTTYYVESSRTANSCPNPNRVAATATVTPIPVAPIIAANNAEVCAGEQVMLTVTNANGATVNWYTAATGGTPVFTGASFVVSPIVTTSYYAEMTNGTCASTARTQAVVTVNARPAAPGVESANVTVCGGSTATLKVVSPENGITYNWYTTATGGTPAGIGATFITPAITQNTTYYVDAASAKGCTNNGGRTVVNIDINGQISAPALSATSTQVCSGGSATISVVNPVAGLQYNFYTAVTGGTRMFTGTTLVLNNITANAVYFVEASNGNGCTSSARTETDITVLAVPAAPQVEAGAGGLSVCAGSSAILNILNPQNNMVYRWYNAPTGGAALYTGTEYHTPALTAATTYYIEASQEGNCNPSTRTAVTITVNDIPDIPALVAANVDICAGSTATFSVSSPQNGIVYRWFDSPLLTNKIFEGATYTTGATTANATYYVVAVNASGCSSTNAATARVTVQAAPGAPTIVNGGTVQTCTGSQLTLTIANPQPGFIYKWYADAISGSPLNTGANFTTAYLTANVTYYAEAINATGCASVSRTPVTINVNSLPAAPVVTANGSTSASVCSGSSAALVATSTSPGVTFNWYTVPTGGTPVFSGPNFTTPALTTITTYYVETVSSTGSCTSTVRTSIQVNINNASAAMPAVNADDLRICQNTAGTIHILNPDASAIYNWYTAGTGGSPVYTGTAFTTPVLAANTTYYVEAVSTQSCNPSGRLAINVVTNVQPAIPIPTAVTVNACKGSPVTLSIASPQSGITYKWYSSDSRTNLLFTGSSFTTGPVNVNTTYYIEAFNGLCTSPALANVQVMVTEAPAAPIVVNSKVSTCTNTQVALEIASPQSGYTYNWYSAETGGAPLYTGVSFTTPTITGNTTFYAEALNTAGCNSATRTPVGVLLLVTPEAPVATSSASICPGGNATLTAISKDANAVITWYSSVTGSTALHTGSTFTTPTLTENTTYYVQAANGAGCSSTTRTPVTVTVSSALTAPVVTIEGKLATSMTFKWNSVPGAQGYMISLDKGKTFITPSSGQNGLTHTLTGLPPGRSVTIMVKAIGSGDCQLSALSDAITATIENPAGNNVYVPNAFTPNNDGKNDILQVYGTTIQKMDFWVYNQWGEMQFHSNTQGSGWDGTYKGKELPVGVYVYYLEATMSDGQQIKKKGTINLLR